MEFQDLAKLEANKDTDTISRMLDEWSEKIRLTDANLQIVEQAYIVLSKELVKLRNELSLKRQEQLDLESSIQKATHTKRDLQSQLKQIDRTYWRSK